jgi:hypothetical protein
MKPGEKWSTRRSMGPYQPRRGARSELFAAGRLTLAWVGLWALFVGGVAGSPARRAPVPPSPPSTTFAIRSP